MASRATIYRYLPHIDFRIRFVGLGFRLFHVRAIIKPALIGVWSAQLKSVTSRARTERVFSPCRVSPRRASAIVWTDNWEEWEGFSLVRARARQVWEPAFCVLGAARARAGNPLKGRWNWNSFAIVPRRGVITFSLRHADSSRAFDDDINAIRCRMRGAYDF